MRALQFIAGALWVTVAWPPSAHAQAAAAPAHNTFSITSRALSEARTVNVYTPPTYRDAPSAMPVLYMPDGGLDEDFPHVVQVVDSLIARGTIRPMLVVGIPNTQRRRDLTGPTRVHSDSAIAPRVGESAAFREFLRAELIPEIERRYRVTRERGLIGESLAGLFVVETFLEDNGLFTHYIALDPSLWWNGESLVNDALSRIAAMNNTDSSNGRTLFLASSREPSTANPAARLAGLLRSVPLRGLRLTFAPRPDLEHATIFRGVEVAAIADAWRTSSTSAPRAAPALAIEAAARQIVSRVPYPTFITTDAAGHPQARTIQPFAPDSNWTVWFATNPRTRKVGQLARHGSVVLHYFDISTLSYVSLVGTARVVRDRATKDAHWNPAWTAFYPDRDSSVVLIEVRADHLEVVSSTLGVEGDKATWRPPTLRVRRP